MPDAVSSLAIRLPKRNCKENLGVQRRNMVRVFRQKPLELKTTDSYTIAALMTQIDGWQRTSNRKTLPCMVSSDSTK